MHGIFFFLVALLLLGRGSIAQEGEPRQLQLTKELVEYLLGALSPPCRHELEQALDSQQKGDFTDECRQEVVYLAQQQMQQENDAQQQQPQQQQQPRSSKRGPPAAPSNVIFTMIGFFALAIAGIAAAVFYINSKRGSWGESRKSKGTKHLKKEMLAQMQKKK